MCKVSFHGTDQEKSRDRKLAGPHGTPLEEGTSHGKSLQRDFCKTGCGLIPPTGWGRSKKQVQVKGKGPLKACQPAPGCFSLHVNITVLLQDPLEKAQCNLILAGKWPLAWATSQIESLARLTPHWKTAPRTWNVSTGRQLYEGRCPGKQLTEKPLVPWVSWLAGSNRLKPTEGCTVVHMPRQGGLWEVCGAHSIPWSSGQSEQTRRSNSGSASKCRLSANYRVSLSAIVTPLTIAFAMHRKFKFTYCTKTL